MKDTEIYLLVIVKTGKSLDRAVPHAVPAEASLQAFLKVVFSLHPQVGDIEGEGALPCFPPLTKALLD